MDIAMIGRRCSLMKTFAAKRLFVSLLILSVLAWSMAPSQGALAETAPITPIAGAKATVNRTVVVDIRYVHIRDDVLVKLNESRSLHGLVLKVSEFVYESVFSMEVRVDGEAASEVTWKPLIGESCRYYEVPVERAVEELSISVDYVLLPNYQFVGGNRFGMDILMATTPIVDSVNASLMIKARDLTKIEEITVDGRPEFVERGAQEKTMTFNNVHPEEAPLLSLKFSYEPGFDRLYTIERLHQRIYLKEGEFWIEETITLRAIHMGEFPGQEKVDEVMLVVPYKSVPEEVTGFDEIGSIDEKVRAETKAGENTTKIYVDLRWGVDQDTFYTFTIAYPVKDVSKFISDAGGGEARFQMRRFGVLDTLISELRVDVVLPSGSSVISVTNANGYTVDGSGRVVVSFVAYNYCSAVEEPFEFTFVPQYHWTWSYLLTLISVPVLLVLLGLMAVPKREEIEAEAGEELKNLLLKLAELLDEKMAIKAEVAAEREELRKKRRAKVKRGEREESIRKVSKQISDLKNEIKRRTSKFNRILNELEKLETQYDMVESNILDLRRQYLTRKVTKRVYEELMEKNKKDLEKISRKIDSLIFTLKEEAELL